MVIYVAFSPVGVAVFVMDVEEVFVALGYDDLASLEGRVRKEMGGFCDGVDILAGNIVLRLSLLLCSWV